MDGVTILNEMSRHGAEMWQVIGVTLVGVIGILALVSNLFRNWKYLRLFDKLVLTGIHAILMMFIVCLVMLVHIDYKKVYTQYKITIDDSVSFNEFNSLYEIISQDGDIYTVVEKQED